MNYLAPLADLETEEALACAAREARRYWLDLATFRACVMKIEDHRETYQRVLHVVDRRTIHLNIVPGASGSPAGVIPSPGMVDPWTVDPRQIEADSRVSAICTDCGGSKRVTCPVCNGGGRASCRQCSGSGRVWAQRKGQLYKNCPTCRGSGQRKCDCSGGTVGCQPCAQTGRVTAWLSVRQVRAEQVLVHPQNSAASVHRDILVPADFDQHQWINQLISDTRPSSQGLTLPAALQPTLEPRSERLLNSRFQTFSSVTYAIDYATVFGRLARIMVAGTPPVISSTSDWSPWLRRKQIIFGTGMALVATAGWVSWRYFTQHEWYSRYGHTGSILMLALIAAACLLACLAGLMLPAPARSWRCILMPLVGAVAYSLGALWSYQHYVPRAEAARASLAAGDMERARLEAHALVDMGLDRSGELMDMLRLQRAESATDIAVLRGVLLEPWYSVGKREQALHRLRTLVEAQAIQLYASGDTAALDELSRQVGDLIPALRDELRWRTAVSRSGKCLVAGDIPCLSATIGGVLAPSLGELPSGLANAQAIREGATHLKEALRQLDSGPSQVRRAALASTLQIAMNYAQALGLPGNATAALQRNTDQMDRHLARAERRARKKDRVDDGAQTSQTAEEASRIVDPFQQTP